MKLSVNPEAVKLLHPLLVLTSHDVRLHWLDTPVMGGDVLVLTERNLLSDDMKKVGTVTVVSANMKEHSGKR